MSLRQRAIPALATLTLLVSGCASVTVQPDTSQPGTPAPLPASPTPVEAATTPPAAAAMPAFSHVYLMVLENEEFGSLVGNAQAPYLNSLIAKYGLATNYDGVAHPSQPNYVALVSGSTQGVTDDNTHDLTGKSLFDQLDAAGKTWNVFAQDYPGSCYTGSTHAGSGEGVGAAGTYGRKHNPAVSFTAITSNPTRCARIQDLAHFDPAVSDFEMIVPNECNDMHSCSIATGDAFLKAFVPSITSSPAFAGGVLFITTDEGKTDIGGGGRVATVVVSPMVTPGFTSGAAYDHYSLLRTIEDSWNLGCLGQACSAANMAEFFH